MAACIATWNFSRSAVLRAQQLLSANANSLDAVEEAIARVLNVSALNLNVFNCYYHPFCTVPIKGAWHLNITRLVAIRWRSQKVQGVQWTWLEYHANLHSLWAKNCAVTLVMRKSSLENIISRRTHVV